MNEKALAARREYYKHWRKINPGKQKEYTARYWEKRAERQTEEEQPKREEEND